MVLGMLIGLVGCSQRSILEREIARQDVASVLKFVDQNLSNQQAHDNVFFCLHQALNSNLPPVIDHFEEIALKGDTGSSLRLEILKEFAAKQRRFKNTAALLDMVARADEQPVRSEALSVLRLSPLDERRSLVTAGLQTDIKLEAVPSWDHSEMQARLGLADDVLPELRDSVTSLRGLEEASVETSKHASDLQDQISSNKLELAGLEAELSKPPFILNGYIVGQHSYGIYEIALSYSGNHALLFAFDTQFQSRGAFSLRVTELSDIPVQLKEDFGGFTQTWKIYSECGATCMNERKENNQKAAGLRTENAAKEAEYESAKQAAATRIKEFDAALRAFTGSSPARDAPLRGSNTDVANPSQQGNSDN